MKVIVTGSNGLVGSEAVRYYSELGCEVQGIDNDFRANYFGKQGSTLWNRDRLCSTYKNYIIHETDIRNRASIFKIIKDFRPELIIHCAAQPSHDLAASIPELDFEVNANGTLNLLEAFRQQIPNAVFIHVSTNKVYGDNPNRVAMKELETRFDYSDPSYFDGIPETLSIDQNTHSLFGVSKTAGDLLAQEYGRYFKLRVGIFRCGCITGQTHSGVELHGFLSYLIKSIIHKRPYTIYGYKGKQVRDQIYSRDLVGAFEEFRKDPRPGEVYNLGGGKENAESILECINDITEITGNSFKPGYSEHNRIGDHICYYSDLRKFRSHYPNWNIKYSLEKIIRLMVDFESDRK